MKSTGSTIRPIGILLVFLASLGLAACEEQGPAEELGEKIDNTVEEAGDAVEQATDQ